MTTHTAAGDDVAPLWLRLTRTGQTVTAYTSVNGYAWTLAGSDTIALADMALFGLAVSSHDPAVAAEAVFDNIRINSFARPVASRLPVGWLGADIGAVGTTGSSLETGGVFALAGAGADIWREADAFHFAHVVLPGDGTITAKVASLDGVHVWSKAGVMVREALSPESAHAFALVSAGRGVAFQRRTSAGALTVHTGGPLVGAPVWLRLTRAGQAITAFMSSDGRSWSIIGSDALAAEGPVHVGLAVSSHDTSRAAGAAFTDVSIGPSAGPARGPGFGPGFLFAACPSKRFCEAGSPADSLSLRRVVLPRVKAAGRRRQHLRGHDATGQRARRHQSVAGIPGLRLRARTGGGGDAVHARVGTTSTRRCRVCLRSARRWPSKIERLYGRALRSGHRDHHHHRRHRGAVHRTHRSRSPGRRGAPVPAGLRLVRAGRRVERRHPAVRHAARPGLPRGLGRRSARHHPAHARHRHQLAAQSDGHGVVARRSARARADGCSTRVPS